LSKMTLKPYARRAEAVKAPGQRCAMRPTTLWSSPFSASTG
jgi:hypothetical protein